MSKTTKYKLKLTTLDVTAQVASLRPKLLGKRLTNIYDIDKKNYLFKVGSGEDKEVIHIEVGIRFNTSLADYDKKTIPSGLTMRMRKHLKSKRIEAIDQLGVERVVRIQLGSGEATYYLFLEFYAKGNMILTDKDLMIIALTRSFEYSETEKYSSFNLRVAVGFKFPVEKSATLKLDDMKVTEEEIDRLNVPGRDGKLPRANDLYFMILRSCHMGMINPILKQFGIKQNDELHAEDKDKFLDALKHGYKFFDRPIAGSGYLIRTKELPPKDTKPSVSEPQSKPEEQGQVISSQKDDHNYIDFTPILFDDYTNDELLAVDECNDFDVAMRTYFETVKIPRDEEANYQNQVWKKYENIKGDQEGRLKQIKDSIDDSYEKAQLIENNINEIQAIIDIVASLISIGMTSIIKGVIGQARKLGDPLANIIKEYNIQERRVSIYLGNEEDLEATMKVVDIDITKTPFDNAKHHYDIRASMTEKERKTQDAANAVLKQARDAAEKKIKKKEQNIKAVKIQRKAQWYEKFYWFVSSENYLVISAKDAHQNETLIKKYLAKDDLVFHTQVQGSAFSLVKNPKGGSVPHETLQEAAQATLCHSRCWDQKLVSEVFWVNAEQVSKTAPTGQFVGLGSFMIYGKKNFITPARLELGFGLFFRVDEDSVKNHEGERKRRDEGNEADTEDPERLINSTVIVSPKVDDGDNSKAIQNQDSINDQEDGQNSDAGAEGSDDGMPAESTTERMSTTSSIQRQLVIDKNTECTYIKNAITSSKGSAKSLTDQKKKAKQEKKATKDGKGGKPVPAKPLPEIVEEPHSKKPMSKAKKRKVDKMAAKYGDMDDDERELQMEMLGAKNIKLSAEAKKQLNNKMREGRGEAIEEVPVEVEPSESEEEMEKETQKGKKGKTGKDKAKETQAGKNPKGNQPKGSKNQPAKGKDVSKPNKKSQEANKEKLVKDQPQTHVIKKAEDISEKPNLEAPETKLTDAKAENIEENTAEIEGEEEMQDLGGSDDDEKDDEKQDPEEIEREEIKKETMSVMNTVLDEEAEKNLHDAIEFKEYTGCPKNNDGLIDCVPVCAPYASMVGYKYRVKLVPGTMKKGKAARQAMNFFEHIKEATNIEKALIKGVDENYAIAQILGNCKVQGQGVQKVKLNEKAAKKAAAKKRDQEKGK